MHSCVSPDGTSRAPPQRWRESDSPLTHNTRSFPERNWLDQDHIGGPDTGPTGCRILSTDRTAIDRMLFVPSTVDIWNSQPTKFSVFLIMYLYYRGADKSLARPGRKHATATEDFDVYISYL